MQETLKPKLPHAQKPTKSLQAFSRADVCDVGIPAHSDGRSTSVGAATITDEV